VLPADEELLSDEEPEPDAGVPGVGGAVRSPVVGPEAGIVEAALARVMEISTSRGWIPNFSKVDDTASDNAPWKLSRDWFKEAWLDGVRPLCPAVEVLVSENMFCR
jgi:hypothetical protein